MKPAPQKSVSLEDLLRLKRAERPSAEFWPQFERELRAKQLAALVVRRPWWRTLPARAMVGLSRYHLPLGATAVLALTFLSVREYRTAAPERTVSPLVGEAPVAVAAAYGLHVSRANGSPLVYNQRDTYMPDLLICRPEWAPRVIELARA